MTRLRSLSLAGFAVVVLAGCGALKDAFTAHSDVVARAASQELTVEALAQILANSNAPLRQDVARTVAQHWVNYQLLGLAGAQGDSLASPEDAEAGMWSSIAQIRTRKYYEIVSADWPEPDTNEFEAAYNRGELLAASHILLARQPTGLVPTANDSIRRTAERLAARATPGNFAALARQYTDDQASRERGGDYGVFPRGQMVAEFEQGILSVPPGGVTGVIETTYGYHIIRRSTWAEVKDEFSVVYANMVTQRAESVFFDAVDRAANVKVRPSAPKLVKAIAEDVDAYRDDRTVVATARSGNLTAERVAHWMAAYPTQSQVRAQLLQAPDSLVPYFVLSIMRNELMLRAADSAGIGLDSTEARDVRQSFVTGVVGTMRALNLAPPQLDTAGTDETARRTLAAARANDYLGRLLRNETPYFEIPEQLALVLRDRYESRVITTGLDRALAEATRMRASADSAATAAAPASQVPLPPQPE